VVKKAGENKKKLAAMRNTAKIMLLSADKKERLKIMIFLTAK
jgi:hypothetical protein